MRILTVSRPASLLVLSLFASSCARPDEPTIASSMSSSHSEALASHPGATGYMHDIARSKFKAGGGQIQRSEWGYQKVVGSTGVFAIDAVNGSARGILNGDVSEGPRTMGEAAHNARVKAYFLSAGLPADQVAGVHATATVTGGGLGSDPLSQRASGGFYTSIVDRVVGGVPVAESHAWARFNDNDEVVAESVYWPELPQAVIDDARELTAILADKVRAKEFTSKLSPSTAVGRVFIRHSSQMNRDAFVAIATYDLPSRDPDAQGVPQRGYGRHFNKTGVEVRLPQEGPLVVPPTPR